MNRKDVTCPLYLANRVTRAVPVESCVAPNDPYHLRYSCAIPADLHHLVESCQVRNEQRSLCDSCAVPEYSIPP